MPPPRRAGGERRLRERVLRAYHKPGHPVAFSAPGAVASHFKIPQSTAKEMLEHSDSYTLHREYKQPKRYNPYYVRSRRDQVQADLIDVAKLKNDNDGVRFLLLLIDIFTKRIWVYPLKSKNAADMLAGMRRWLGELDVKPEKILTDRGNEFRNRRVQELLRDSGVEWMPGNGVLKAAIAERVNKTLQILMYKYLSENETTRYIDVLPDLVRTYNKRPHRTVGMPPAEADKPRNHLAVHAAFLKKYNAIARHRKTNLPFKVGDMVRIKTDAHKVSSSSRAYAEQFHGNFYNVVRINRTLPIAMFHLRDANDGEHIEGGFYANELQRVRGDIWKIESVLERRVRRGVREVKVKWRHFDQTEWIPEANLVRRY